MPLSSVAAMSIGGVFAVAAISKAWQPGPTVGAIRSASRAAGFEHVGQYALLVVAAVIILELLLAGWLLMGWRQQLSLWAAATILAVFTGFLGYLWTIGETSCGCRLPLLPDEIIAGMIRNVVLAAGVVAALRLDPAPTTSRTNGGSL